MSRHLSRRLRVLELAILHAWALAPESTPSPVRALESAPSFPAASQLDLPSPPPTDPKAVPQTREGRPAPTPKDAA